MPLSSVSHVPIHYPTIKTHVCPRLLYPILLYPYLNPVHSSRCFFSAGSAKIGNLEVSLAQHSTVSQLGGGFVNQLVQLDLPVPVLVPLLSWSGLVWSGTSTRIHYTTLHNTAIYSPSAHFLVPSNLSFLQTSRKSQLRSSRLSAPNLRNWRWKAEWYARKGTEGKGKGSLDNFCRAYAESKRSYHII